MFTLRTYESYTSNPIRVETTITKSLCKMCIHSWGWYSVHLRTSGDREDQSILMPTGTRAQPWEPFCQEMLFYWEWGRGRPGLAPRGLRGVDIYQSEGKYFNILTIIAVLIISAKYQGGQSPKWWSTAFPKLLIQRNLSLMEKNITLNFFVILVYIFHPIPWYYRHIKLTYLQHTYFS